MPFKDTGENPDELTERLSVLKLKLIVTDRHVAQVGATSI